MLLQFNYRSKNMYLLDTLKKFNKRTITESQLYKLYNQCIGYHQHIKDNTIHIFDFANGVQIRCKCNYQIKIGV